MKSTRIALGIGFVFGLAQLAGCASDSTSQAMEDDNAMQLRQSPKPMVRLGVGDEVTLGLEPGDGPTSPALVIPLPATAAVAEPVQPE